MTIEDFNPDATEDFGELAADETVFLALAEYCRLRALAITQRLNGAVNFASITEAKMQGIYNRLPESARW